MHLGRRQSPEAAAAGHDRGLEPRPGGLSARGPLSRGEGRGRGGAWTCPAPARSFQAWCQAWNRGMWELPAASPPASRAGPGPGSSPQPPSSIRQRTNTAHQRHAADPHALQRAHLAVTPPEDGGLKHTGSKRRLAAHVGARWPSCLGSVRPEQGCLVPAPPGLPSRKNRASPRDTLGRGRGRDQQGQGPEGAMQGRGQGVLCSPRKGPYPRTTQSLTSVAPTAPGVRTVAQRQIPCTCPRRGQPHQSWHTAALPQTWMWKKQVAVITVRAFRALSTKKRPSSVRHVPGQTLCTEGLVAGTKLHLHILPAPSVHSAAAMVSHPPRLLPRPLSSCVLSSKLHTLSEPRFRCLSNAGHDRVYPYRLH